MELDKVKKELQEARAYCQQVNGRSSCKNCGLDFGKLIDLLEAKDEEHQFIMEATHLMYAKKETEQRIEHKKELDFYKKLLKLAGYKDTLPF